MTTLYIDMEHNDRNTLFGIPTEPFWKLFLAVHDRTSDRGEFAEELEREILDYHVRSPKGTWAVGTEWAAGRVRKGWNGTPTSISVVNSSYYNRNNPPRPFQAGSKLLPQDTRSGVSCAYLKMVRRCAKFFGVDTEMITELPKVSKNKARLQSYFISRTTSCSSIRRVS